MIYRRFTFSVTQKMIERIVSGCPRDEAKVSAFQDYGRIELLSHEWERMVLA